ncbi:MAG: flagellar basal body rod protein FlgB [Nevskia sp.]|nr:flagellar basal body rod protein FlgB [Nevskia sp.]
MADINSVFGAHASSMTVQQQRMEVLAANLANADTPHYQARDIDFAKVLADQQQASAAAPASPAALATTNPGHLGGTAASGATMPALNYRIPMQPSVDGNTVDEQVEQSAFADAAMHYQASLSFLSGDIKSVMTAITGQ